MTFGWFTPTEAAIAACAWAIVLGIFLYRTLTPKQFYKVSMETIETTAGVLLIVAAASLFGWVLTTTRVTEYTTEALLALTDNRYVILLLTNILLLVVGCFLEPIASISILVPVLMPVILKVGIDPVHFGVMQRLITQLPGAFREALVLREVNDLSYREIADVTGVPVGTVMSRLARARGLLRTAWLAEEKGP